MMYVNVEYIEPVLAVLPICQMELKKIVQKVANLVKKSPTLYFLCLINTVCP